MIDKLLSENARREIFAGERKGIHSSAHWFKVAQLGVAIALAEGGDPVIPLLFGLYHDCRRENDGYDYDHGKRAAELINSHFESGDLKISLEQCASLKYACYRHSEGRVSMDINISACWDADRLDLPRCGTQTDPEFLGTKTAKKMAEYQAGFYHGDSI